MQFRVPQFIELEDKIFGPFTFKQFLYLGGGAGICFIFYKLFPLFIAMFFIAPVAGLSLALAFYQVNNRPFINVLESALRYLLQNKLYVWKKEEKKITTTDTALYKESFTNMHKLSQSKLKDIAWSLDVHESIYREGGDGKPKS